jgi:hypothetical protein
MNKEVGSYLEEAGLLGHVTPEVNAGSHVGRACLTKDRLTRAKEVRMVVLLRQAKAA